MTEPTKVRAGIKPAKCVSKKGTKDNQIRELEARLAVYEHPDDADPLSKDPLVS
jgi:hypothetical protein